MLLLSVNEASFRYDQYQVDKSIKEPCHALKVINAIIAKLIESEIEFDETMAYRFTSILLSSVQKSMDVTVQLDLEAGKPIRSIVFAGKMADDPFVL